MKKAVVQTATATATVIAIRTVRSFREEKLAADYADYADQIRVYLRKFAAKHTSASASVDMAR